MRHTVSLKNNREFRSLYARGKNTAGLYLALYARKNRYGVTRLGITVSGKLGNAVTRNRIRRRIKEAYRIQEEQIEQGFDIVIVGRSRVIGADFSALRGELLTLCKKMSLTRGGRR